MNFRVNFWMIKLQNCIDKITELHGPPMLVDKPNFGLLIYKQANFYRFEELSRYCWGGQKNIKAEFSYIDCVFILRRGQAQQPNEVYFNVIPLSPYITHFKMKYFILSNI